ncbi:helix-turn-helix domain-containing protein [Pseudoduganella sp. FT25W]|jgi:AraC family transcriptional regulator|uniref:Helix-turn-helix domain-containing protein n=1 Tax=Duganella alba TaxID=2666081 RepID=A0A6L5QC54_9BURK|nr:AraC family transcriptional regulator [Duganella alba]MRX07383.1 helix-turn-helix domain-containing protein [Duganella alba]MRX19485.1 helix-turn-helix domain-containing protein [Duganella alba]
MNLCIEERAGRQPAVLEAHCHGMHIRIGRGLYHEPRERSHDDHEIAAPGTHASAILTYRDADGEPQQIKVSDRHICVIPAGHVHTAAWPSEAQLTSIAVKPAFLHALARANGYLGHEIAPQYASVDPFMWHMARSIEQQMQSRRELEKSYVESVAIIIGQHLLCTYTDTPAPSASLGGLPRYKIRRAVDYIRAHFQEDIGFKDIADQLDMSPYHFARMFKHSMQESPHQFIMRCRIESAKKMLIESDKSIADIAFDVGYKSQSYFTTRFALLVGVTPAAFRGAR